ncbi:zinc ribbon domain-containing protein [Micromonosporaceae bacterium B7E4]
MRTLDACPACRTVLLPGHQRCLRCGAAVGDSTRTCPDCTAESPLASRFCGNCGRDLDREVAADPDVAADPPAGDPGGQSRPPDPAPGHIPLADPGVDPDRVFLATRAPGPRRRGLRVIIAAVVGVLCAGVVALAVVRSVAFGPEPTIEAYFTALADRDAAAALRALNPPDGDQPAEPEPPRGDGEPGGGEPGDGTLTSPLLTDAVLTADGYQPPGEVRIEKLETVEREARNEAADGGDDLTVATVAYTAGGERFTATLVLEPAGRTAGLFPRWRITDGALSTLRISADGTEQVLVNGVPVGWSDAGGDTGDRLSAFPGSYTVNLPDQPLLAATPVTAAVGGRGAEVTLATTVRESARGEVEQAVKAYVDRCAASTDLSPDGCPFSSYTFYTVTDVSWRIGTYPTIAVALSRDGEQVVVTNTRRGTAEATGTARGFLSPTQYRDSVSFAVTGTARVEDGKVVFQPTGR